MNPSLLYATLLLAFASGAIAQQPNDGTSAPPAINNDSTAPKDQPPKDAAPEIKSPSDPNPPAGPLTPTKPKRSGKKSSKKSTKKPAKKSPKKSTTRPPGNNGGSCTQVVRREIRDLSASERQRYFDAIKALMRSQNGRLSTYENFTRIHYENSNDNHGYAQFFPWHRVFVRKFELAIQSVDSSISAIPYWDWSADAEAPELSVIFSSDWYGGDGDSRGCVRTGQFANFRPQFRNNGRQCMQRRFNAGRGRIGAFVPVEVLSRIIGNQRNYDGFRRAIEGQPHAAVHNGLGAMFSTMASPTDPVFWLHHAMIDKIYMDWQLRDRSRRFREYYGRASHGSASPRDRMSPWGIPASAGIAAEVEGGCISYVQGSNVWSRRSVPSSPRNNGNGDGRRRGNGDGRRGNGGGDGRGNGRMRMNNRGPIRRRRRLGPRSLFEDNEFPSEFPAEEKEAEPKSEEAAGSDKAASAMSTETPASDSTEAPKETEALDNIAEVPSSSIKAPENSAKAPKNTTEAPESTNKTTEGVAKAAANATASINSAADKNATIQGVTLIDNYKDSKCTDENGVYVACPDDRENLLDLRAPVPIPTEWLKMNNQDVAYVRQQEKDTRNTCNKLNNIEGYVSPSALWNREDFIEKLAEKGAKFKVVYGKKLVKINYNARERNFVKKIKEEVEEVGIPVNKPYGEVHQKIDKVLGSGADYMHHQFRNNAGTVYHEENDDYCEEDDDDDEY